MKINAKGWPTRSLVKVGDGILFAFAAIGLLSAQLIEAPMTVFEVLGANILKGPTVKEKPVEHLTTTSDTDEWLNRLCEQGLGKDWVN